MTTVTDVTDKFTFNVTVNTNRTKIFKIGNIVYYNILLSASVNVSTVIATMNSSLATKNSLQFYACAYNSAGSGTARATFEGTSLTADSAIPSAYILSGIYLI